MAVSREEAEEYELAGVGDDGRGQASSSRLSDHDYEGSEGEHARLLEHDGKLRLSEEVDGFLRSAHDDEPAVGKSSKVEELIARTVPTTDDPSLPTLTARVVLLGSGFCIMGASASTIFYFKSNAPSFSSYFVILATYPLGHMLANERIIPRHKRLLGIDLNPGKFSIKEAILVSVLASSGATSAYAADILAVLDLYFKAPLSMVPSIILLLTTQCIGFGLAGMLYNLLVARPAMYWPSSLVMVQLFTTLYDSTSATLTASQRQLTQRRLRVFVAIFAVTFVWQFLPMLLFPTLTSVAVLCLINNNSWWMRTLGGAYEGLGMFDFSFDWASIGASNPLYTPYWALGNWFGGLILMIWVIVPILLATNFWDARSFSSPTTSALFNSTFHTFDVASVLLPDLSLDESAFDAAKPLLLTPYFAITYGLAFSALSSIIVHVWLWHRREITEALTSRAPMDDIHNTLMRAYRGVPHSWYLVLLGVNFAAAVIMVMTAAQLQTPVWALVLSLVIAFVFLIPIGVVAAVSNTQIGLNVLTELIAGILMPGKPIANITFKCFGYMAMSQALTLVQDLKLGWYTCIPPREMFVAQVVGTVLGALTNCE